MPGAPAGADFDALDEVHRQIGAHLVQLDALVAHLDRVGVDPHAQAEARTIEAFFSSTSRRHHQEEESRVFPPLLASTDVDLVAKVRMLQQDHGWIEEDWLVIAPQLRALADGGGGYEPEELRHAVQVFLELCREHILLEESIVYPEAKAAAQRLLRRRAERSAARPTAAGPSSS
jgi:hemerythrin-like domain-containing protein